MDFEQGDYGPIATKYQMERLAAQLFGENAEVRYSDHDGWQISTKVNEKFEEELYKDREAYALYIDNSGGENQLERWAWKNGHSSESMAELFDSYDEEQEATSRRIIAEVRRHIAEGRSFVGLEDWRDRVLAYAEENGL